MTNFEFALLCFTSLFAVLNPIGVIPVYLKLTEDMDSRRARAVVIKSTLIAVLILVLFALTGRFIFQFFHISVHGLRIVGGIIFFIIGFEMLNARLSFNRKPSESVEEYANDIAITPLAIPVICGPGSMTTAIILMNDSQTMIQQGILLSIIVLVMVITFFVLSGARKIMKVLGPDGNKVLMRIMGLILMVMAVEFFFGGLKPILQDILKIS